MHEILYKVAKKYNFLPEVSLYYIILQVRTPKSHLSHTFFCFGKENSMFDQGKACELISRSGFLVHYEISSKQMGY